MSTAFLITSLPRAHTVQIISAGHFTTEDLDDKGPNWDEEVLMYTTSSIAPVFIVHALHKANLLSTGSKVVLVSSESGSITLRHEKEGGGNYAHHASKAALNMVGKLLSLDLKERGVIISIVHPGFMRTEMTKGVGFDQYWDDGGGRSIRVLTIYELRLTIQPSPRTRPRQRSLSGQIASTYRRQGSIGPRVDHGTLAQLSLFWAKTCLRLCNFLGRCGQNTAPVCGRTWV